VTDAPPSAAERRRVTVTFSDLTGFTAMTEQLEAEDVRDVMDAIFNKAAHIIDRYGGRIASLLGDGVMAVFGDPVANEDDAIRAVRAVIELHDAVDTMSPAIERHIGRPVRMHSGIETGMVVTSPTAFLGAVAGLVGDTVNVAARLEDLSSTGEILVGPNTYQLVANLVEVEEHGRVELKGKGSTGVCPAGSPRADADGAAGIAPDPVRRSSA
jgi:class 3 adenylate cyclase